MSRLPTTIEIEQGHRRQIELGLCRRDFELMSIHHAELLDEIEAAIRDGVTPFQIKRWATSTVDESALVQRVYNAARYCLHLAEG